MDVYTIWCGLNSRGSADGVFKLFSTAALSGDPRVGEVGEKGYKLGGNGEPRSTVLFETWNERLESAINRIRGKSEDQRRLFEVLARLHVLKGWGYAKLARLVFGPDQEANELKKNGDRIRKWIQGAIRHIRAEKRRNEAKRQKKCRDATAGREYGGTANNGDPTGDERT